MGTFSRVLAGAAAALLAVTSAGCTDSDDPPRAGDGPRTVTMDPAANHVEALGGSRVAFGERATTDDGVTVVVQEPRPHDPPPSARGTGEGFVEIGLRLVNDSDSRVLDVTVMVESGGGQAGELLHERRGLVGPPRVVKAGSSQRWSQVFDVAELDDVTVTVQAGTDRLPVSFGRP